MSFGALAERVIRRTWNRPQSQFLKIRAVAGGQIQYINLEGAIGSGKTTAPAWKMVEYVTSFPGIHVALSAWTDEMLGPPKSAFLAAAREQGFSPEDGTLKWHGGQGEEFYLVKGYNSRVYVRSMKASEDDMRYLKLAGLNLSVLWIDQPEPVPQDVYNAYVPARLRQPGFPHEVWLSPNPLDDSHWLSKEFPPDPKKRPENFHYIRTTLYDNKAIVGPQFVADMEQKHPPGSSLRHRFIDGTRGPMSRGKPIYGGEFRPGYHDVELEPVEESPILQGHDFGTKHPAVVWAQLPWWGQLRILGSIEGDDLFIESFVPILKEWRTEWYGENRQFMATCDPSGGKATRDGIGLNGVKVLNGHGIHPQYEEHFNQPTSISYALETIGGYLSRQVTQPIWFDDRCEYCRHHRPNGLVGERLPRDIVVGGGAILHGRQVPAFQIDTRRHLVVSNTDVEERSVLMNGFKGGYVYGPNTPIGGVNLKRPFKDEIHDHTMRCVEYIIQQFAKDRVAEKALDKSVKTASVRLAGEEAAALRKAQRDDHPVDGAKMGRVTLVSKAGRRFVY